MQCFRIRSGGEKFFTVREIAEGLDDGALGDEGRLWFLRPVADGKG